MIDPFTFHLLLPTCVAASKQSAENRKQINDTEADLFMELLVCIQFMCKFWLLVTTGLFIYVAAYPVGTTHYSLEYSILE